MQDEGKGCWLKDLAERGVLYSIINDVILNTLMITKYKKFEKKTWRETHGKLIQFYV